MAHDLVKIHGDLAEFLGDRRCGACQQGNRKCINQEDDDRCMLCNDAGRQCVFERSMMIKAPRTDFPWDALLCKETPRLVSGLVNHPMSEESRALSIKSKNISNRAGAYPHLTPSRTPQTKKVPLDLDRHQPGVTTSDPSSRLSSRQEIINSGDDHTAADHGGPISTSGFTAFRLKGPENEFVLTPSENKKIRVHSQAERDEIAKKRKIGACETCRQKKKKKLSTPDPAASTSVAASTSSVLDSPEPRFSTPLPEPAAGIVLDSSTVLDEDVIDYPFTCPVLTCPRHTNGYRLHSDLDRHSRTVHKSPTLATGSAAVIANSSSGPFYKCAAPGCLKAHKIWPRLDNFRQHCLRTHPIPEVEVIIKRSTITNPQSVPQHQEQPQADEDPTSTIPSAQTTDTTTTTAAAATTPQPPSLSPHSPRSPPSLATLQQSIPSRQQVYRCAVPDCSKATMLWSRLGNFKQHCVQMHADLDLDDIIAKSQNLDSEVEMDEEE